MITRSILSMSNVSMLQECIPLNNTPIKNNIDLFVIYVLFVFLFLFFFVVDITLYIHATNADTKQIDNKI